MTQANLELLDALQAAGAPEDKARAAAQSIAPVGDVATKADLAKLKADVKADLAELETRLTWRLVGGMAILLAAMSVGFGLMGFLLNVN